MEICILEGRPVGDVKFANLHVLILFFSRISHFFCLANKIPQTNILQDLETWIGIILYRDFIGLLGDLPWVYKYNLQPGCFEVPNGHRHQLSKR